MNTVIQKDTIRYPMSTDSHYHGQLDHEMAQKIVSRTMDIIQCNVNIMDDHGVIIGSGDLERIGELHEGALLALTNNKMFVVDNSLVGHLRGVQPGINMPIRQNNRSLGVIGLTGKPAQLIQYAKLVTMTAEMMLEQSQLLSLIAQDQRLREELVLHLIHHEILTDEPLEWASRLNIDLTVPRVAVIIEVEADLQSFDNTIYELQTLLTQLNHCDHHNLVARISFNKIIVLKPILIRVGDVNTEAITASVKRLYDRITKHCRLPFYMAVGSYFAESGRAEQNGLYLSYNVARTTLKIGKLYHPKQTLFYYHQLQLPVLLDSLHSRWQTAEFIRPLRKLNAFDTNGLLRKTLMAWFNNNIQPCATAKALYIHRNTLEYRLQKIHDLTGLDIKGSFNDRILLYIGLQLNDSE